MPLNKYLFSLTGTYADLHFCPTNSLNGPVASTISKLSIFESAKFKLLLVYIEFSNLPNVSNYIEQQKIIFIN